MAGIHHTSCRGNDGCHLPKGRSMKELPIGLVMYGGSLAIYMNGISTEL